MSVKSIVANRLEKARAFANSVRAVYEDAYNKTVEMRESDVSEFIREVPVKVRAAVEERVQDVQATFDGFNQSLADKAIPPFRKLAVSREKLDQKAKGVKRPADEAKSEGSKAKAKAKTKAAPKSSIPTAKIKALSAKASNSKAKASGSKSAASKKSKRAGEAT